jgi:hypothetical protein
VIEALRLSHESDRGEIAVWSPPFRLGYVRHIRRHRQDATEVDLRFVEAATG